MPGIDYVWRRDAARSESYVHLLCAGRVNRQTSFAKSTGRRFRFAPNRRPSPRGKEKQRSRLVPKPASHRSEAIIARFKDAAIVDGVTFRVNRTFSAALRRP